MYAETLEAIRRSAAIPALPAVVARCLQVTRDPEADHTELVRVLSADPGIVADLLRVSNSALFGLSRTVQSVHHAVLLLGMWRVRDLVLARSLIQSLDDRSVPIVNHVYFWRRALTTGSVACRLADTVAPQIRDASFVAGTLADVGVLVLGRALPDRYRALGARYAGDDPDAWVEAENLTMGLTHADVTAAVLDEWKLPPLIVEGVRHHHTPSLLVPTDSPGRDMALVVGAAGRIARALCDLGDPIASANACARAAEEVGLEPLALVSVIRQVEADVEELAQGMRIEVARNGGFRRVAQQVGDRLMMASA